MLHCADISDRSRNLKENSIKFENKVIAHFHYRCRNFEYTPCLVNSRGQSVYYIFGARIGPGHTAFAYHSEKGN